MQHFSDESFSCSQSPLKRSSAETIFFLLGSLYEEPGRNYCLVWELKTTVLLNNWLALMLWTLWTTEPVSAFLWQRRMLAHHKPLKMAILNLRIGPCYSLYFLSLPFLLSLYFKIILNYILYIYKTNLNF